MTLAQDSALVFIFLETRRYLFCLKVIFSSIIEKLSIFSVFYNVAIVQAYLQLFFVHYF